MCVETLLILHLHKVFGLFPNCQGINGVLQRDPALLGCNYFHKRFCTAFGGALWIIIINRMKLLLSKLLSKVIWFPLLVYSVARGIKWYPVDFQAAHAGWWEFCWAGLLSLWQVQKGCRWQRTIPLSQKQSSCMGHGGFVSLGWGWRSLLLWCCPNLGLVLHYRHILHVHDFMEICT